MILDGWGYREELAHNAIAQAKKPQWDAWWRTRPHMLLEASGHHVGLPDNQVGNSEVGHMHIGAGRIISQDLTCINSAIDNGEYAENPVLTHVIEEMKQHHKAIHVIGLLSPGGVHSHENHLFAFLSLCAQHHFKNVFLHLFLDGRDTPPQSAAISFERLQQQLIKYPVAKIASISGRYYAMDRDQRWQRIKPVYDLITAGESDKAFATAENALEAFYQEGIFDEFIPPTRIGPIQPVKEGDTIFFFNYRSDRARQLTEALILPDFHAFARKKVPDLAHFVSMTVYADYLPTTVVFPPQILAHTLGEVLADAGLRQLRIAETEKYAHVTFFLNGGSEHIFPGESRILVPSPKIATYDLQPCMSALQLTDKLVEAINGGQYDVIICNYANADMVGHSGNLPATIAAIECLDEAMRQVGDAILANEGQMLITADHGNADCMFDEATQQPHTAHTHELVPLLYIGQNWHFKKAKGNLIDIAPTLLTLLGITPPPEMTGEVLMVKNHD